MTVNHDVAGSSPAGGVILTFGVHVSGAIFVFRGLNVINVLALAFGIFISDNKYR